jgi:small subunit ribosomal protein S1
MLSPGDIVRARIVRIAEYGLWMEHEGASILVLIVDISWQGRVYLEKMFRVGEELEVKLLYYIPKREQWKASIKELHPEMNPWREPSLYTPGLRYTGKVTTVVDYGFFVQLPLGAVGLIHRSETERALKVGDTVEVAILECDLKMQRILLRPV